MNAEREFEIGDVVRLRSGGPHMIVCDVESPYPPRNKTISLVVFWTDAQYSPCVTTLPAVCFVMELPLRKQ